MTAKTIFDNLPIEILVQISDSLSDNDHFNFSKSIVKYIPKKRNVCVFKNKK